MTDKRHLSKQPVGEMPGEEALEQLFKRASPRLLPPEEDERIVREALYAEWDQLMGRRQRRRSVVQWAMAASVLIVVGAVALTVVPNLLQSPPQVAAHVERVLGPSELEEDGAWHALTAEPRKLYADHVLKTSTGGRVGIRLAGGGALRLDQNSELRLERNGEVELKRGALYFDSRSEGGLPGKIKVRTAFGTVRNVGTVFTASVSDSGLDVRVREGKVQTGGPHELTGRAAHTRTGQRIGQRIELPSSGPPRITDISVYGEEWKWVERIAPSFDLEGRRVVEFLEWVARETGLGIQYATSEVEQMAREEEFYGIQFKREPLDALEMALMTVGLKHELRQDGVIFVSK